MASNGTSVIVYASDASIRELGEVYLRRTGLESPVHLCDAANVNDTLVRESVAFAFVRRSDLRQYWERVDPAMDVNVFTFLADPPPGSKGVGIYSQMKNGVVKRE